MLHTDKGLVTVEVAASWLAPVGNLGDEVQAMKNDLVDTADGLADDATSPCLLCDEPMIVVNYQGEKMKSHPEEISAMILTKSSSLGYFAAKSFIKYSNKDK